MLLQLALVLEPWVREQLRSRRSLTDLLRKGLLQEVDGLLANWLEERFVVVDVGVDDHVLDLLLGLAGVRVAARQQHVGDDADAPNVDLLVIGHLNLLILTNANDLRSHVQRTTEDEVEALLWVEKARETEVSNLYTQIVDILRLEKNVLWLQVTMRDVLVMHVVDSQQDLVNDHGGFWFTELLNLNNSIKQFATFEELASNVEAIVILKQLGYRHNIRMHALLKHGKLRDH